MKFGVIKNPMRVSGAIQTGFKPATPLEVLPTISYDSAAPSGNVGRPQAFKPPWQIYMENSLGQSQRAYRDLQTSPARDIAESDPIYGLGWLLGNMAKGR